MDVMDNGSAEDGEDENEDVYARYVGVVVLLNNGGLTASRYFRIRIPRSEMALGFKGGYAGAQVRLFPCTCPRTVAKRGTKTHNSFA
jgi:hypothetical protein